MDLGIAGKVGIVTGATRGIGAAIARLLLEEGAFVYGTGRTAASAADAAAQFEFARDRVMMVAGDAFDPDTPNRIVDGAVSAFGRLDFVINNAASLVYKGIEDLDRDDWERLTGEKLVVSTALIQAARPHLEATSGAVVNMSGVAGSIPAGETPHIGAVNAGVVAMSRWFAAHFASFGIRVNSISPAGVETDRWEERVRRLEELGLSRSEADVRMVQDIPLAKPVQPSEVAGVAVALCSSSFQSVTGVNVIVDGGRHVHGSAFQ